ncbi:MAG: class GN sortase [Nitrospiraceae bacterium]
MNALRRIRRWQMLCVLLLVSVGSWQVGHGLWIYAKAQLAQVLLQRAWSRTMAGEQAVRPWPWADTWPVAQLDVPHLGITQIVLANASGRTLAFGPARQDEGSAALPRETWLVSGHRDTHFAFLSALRAGDRLRITDRQGSPREYRVASLSVIDSRDGLAVSDDETPRLILLTCYPFDTIVPGGPLRYVVTAELDQPPAATVAQAVSTASSLPAQIR